MSLASYLQDHTLYTAPNYSPLPIIIEKGEGSWLWDTTGKKYLDFHSAYSGTNFGHLHPKLIQAAKNQLDKLTLTSRAFLTDNLAPFCKELAEYCDMEMVLPMNSGGEAVETAIKLARKWGYEKKKVEQNKAEIIVFSDNFHGRTTTIISFSDSDIAHANYGPYTPGFVIVPYGDMDAVKKAINKNTVAVLVEPLQGEAGIVLPPPGFLTELRKITKENNILFLADEIQSGFGRTGKRFCCDHENVIPDIYIVGKSLGGGIVPISAIVGKREVLTVFQPGTHGSTFSGNPLACAVAREALRILKDDGVIEHSMKLSLEIDALLKSMVGFGVVTAVRGQGLWFGVDIDPKIGYAKKVCEKIAEKGVLCKDTRKHSIRIAPPLNIGREDLLWGVGVLIGVLVA